MANIFPIKEDLRDLPYSEIVIYELLEKLPDSFYVFHSVQWAKKSNKWKTSWKENDFLILHPSLGALVLEIKGGSIECRRGVFYQVNTKTHETNILSSTKKNDPLSQAIDGIYHYRELIHSLIPDIDNRFPIEAAVWFPSCEIKPQINMFPIKYREISGAILGYEDKKKVPRQ